MDAEAEMSDDGYSTVQKLPPMEWIPRSLQETDGEEIDRLRKAWPEVVSKCGMVEPLLSRYLKDCWPQSLSNTHLVIGVDPEFSDEVQQLQRLQRGAMRNLFHRFLGRALVLDFVVLAEPVRWSHLEPEEAEVDESEPFDPETAGRNRNQWARDPAINLILGQFLGDVIDIQL